MENEDEKSFCFNPNDELSPTASKEETSDDFIFESDSYALRHNKDYQLLVKTLIQLEAQKIQAIKGLEKLHEAREAILKDPFAFVRALQNGESLNLPNPIDVVEVPEIEWSKYDIHPILQDYRPKTRRLAKESTISDPQENGGGEAAEDAKSSSKSERTKTETFNVQWTLEEQRKLEELLIKYPDEPMSSKRWAKIAKELGTRSLMQVQSRVQKYFIALKKEGLPVPGKNPKRALLGKHSKKRATHGQSSFMRAFDFEYGRKGLVEEDEKDVMTEDDTYLEKEISDDEDVLEELRDTQEYQELLRLKRAKRLKAVETKSGRVVHYGFSCNGCNCNPIQGPRWHCTECPQDPGVDFCEQCANYFQDDVHLRTHIAKPVKTLSLKDTIAWR